MTDNIWKYLLAFAIGGVVSYAIFNLSLAYKGDPSLEGYSVNQIEADLDPLVFEHLQASNKLIFTPTDEIGGVNTDNNEENNPYF